MATQLSPSRVRSEHQRLHHFVADAPWSDEAVLDAVSSYALERTSRRVGAPEALIIDDTGFPKKGKHSVGSRGSTAAKVTPTVKQRFAAVRHLFDRRPAR